MHRASGRSSATAAQPSVGAASPRREQADEHVLHRRRRSGAAARRAIPAAASAPRQPRRAAPRPRGRGGAAGRRRPCTSSTSGSARAIGADQRPRPRTPAPARAPRTTAVSWRGVPSTRIRPPCMKPTRVQRDASSMYGVRHDDRAAVREEPDQQLPELLARDRVHAAGRLVEQQHRGLVDQRAGEPQLLLHAARERVGATLLEAGEAHEAQQLRGAGPERLAADAAHLARRSAGSRPRSGRRTGENRWAR